MGGVSGGKDSAALAIYMRDRVPGMEYFFCDTGSELPETYEYLTRLEAVLGGPAIQATCLECPAVAPANLGRTTPPTASAWARVAAWLAG